MSTTDRDKKTRGPKFPQQVPWPNTSNEAIQEGKSLGVKSSVDLEENVLNDMLSSKGRDAGTLPMGDAAATSNTQGHHNDGQAPVINMNSNVPKAPNIHVDSSPRSGWFWRGTRGRLLILALILVIVAVVVAVTSVLLLGEETPDPNPLESKFVPTTSEPTPLEPTPTQPTLSVPKPSETTPTQPASKDLMFLAFYYPWYIRDDWSQHGTQGSSPMLGHYGSNESEVAERHIEMAVRGGIEAWVVSWWTQDSPVTANFVKGMLSAKNIDKIKFCMLYESKGNLPVDSDFANGTLVLDKFISDMIFFRDSYFGHPSYLLINGRPVVYVYLTRNWINFEPFMLEKIKTAVGKDILIIADDPYFGHNIDPATAQNGVKNGKPVFEAYTSYNMYESDLVREGEMAVDYMLREALPIFKKWSQETVFFPHLLPKYHDFREGHKPMVGDAAGLLTQLETFACLPRPPSYKNEFPDLMFVTSFNEWWEGTSIEPDDEDEYGFTFLDTITAFKDSEVQCQ